MKMQIKEFAKLTGVSVRTLHYYDEIGLLKPALVDAQNGYRFYDENSLLRMQEILFYRELDFPLKSILEILSSPDYNKQKALAKQRKLLELKKERLERIIDARTEEEFAEGHIENAILIPEYEIKDRAQKELPDKEQLILVYCRSGRRSKIASEELVKLGYNNVKEFGGIIDWPYEVIK